MRTTDLRNATMLTPRQVAELVGQGTGSARTGALRDLLPWVKLGKPGGRGRLLVPRAAVERLLHLDAAAETQTATPAETSADVQHDAPHAKAA